MLSSVFICVIWLPSPTQSTGPRLGVQSTGHLPLSLLSQKGWRFCAKSRGLLQTSWLSHTLGARPWHVHWNDYCAHFNVRTAGPVLVWYPQRWCSVIQRDVQTQPQIFKESFRGFLMLSSGRISSGLWVQSCFYLWVKQYRDICGC